ncbi:uncharacterized protein A4U43_C07F18700 [Asparagus officinalis]|uniref:Uncharacterized protein n=1 Tax=Asparagus officinalis TaxID=4686 RepID=A0A5P1ED04_ASPOF|nr:uncharacterized protein A4U43_C07F18700 [Asparagus officinalis]
MLPSSIFPRSSWPCCRGRLGRPLYARLPATATLARGPTRRLRARVLHRRRRMRNCTRVWYASIPIVPTSRVRQPTLPSSRHAHPAVGSPLTARRRLAPSTMPPGSRHLGDGKPRCRPPTSGSIDTRETWCSSTATASGVAELRFRRHVASQHDGSPSLRPPVVSWRSPLIARPVFTRLGSDRRVRTSFELVFERCDPGTGATGMDARGEVAGVPEMTVRYIYSFDFPEPVTPGTRRFVLSSRDEAVGGDPAWAASHNEILRGRRLAADVSSDLSSAGGQLEQCSGLGPEPLSGLPPAAGSAGGPAGRRAPRTANAPAGCTSPSMRS